MGEVRDSFRQPEGVAIDAERNVYVADSGNKRVQELSPSGHVQATWNLNDGPTGVAVDGAGNVYIASANRQV